MATYREARKLMQDLGLPPSWANAAMVDEALKRGVTVKAMDKNPRILFARGGQRYRWNNGSTTFNTQLARTIGRFKDLQSRIFLDHGISNAPENSVFSPGQAERAWRWAESLGTLVVRPHNGTHGDSVYLGINTWSDFEEAFTRISEDRGQVLVEKFYEGVEHRCLVVDSKLVAVTRRRPASVVGDGESTISELVALKNVRRGKIHKRLQLGESERLYLARTGWYFDSVPADGERVYLLGTSNIHTGGDAVDATNDLSAEQKATVEKAVAAIPGLKVVGLDVLLPEGGVASDMTIIEINSAPMISMHHFPWEGRARNVAAKIMDAMFPATPHIGAPVSPVIARSVAEESRSPAQQLVLAAVDNAKSADRLMRAAVERSFQADLIADASPDRLASRTSRIREHAMPQHISHNALRRTERNRLSMKRSISFRTKVHEMSEARYLGGVLRPTWKLDIKNSAYEFVDAIGARRPESDKQRYSFAEAPKRFPGVLKATRATGSRGCYLLFSEDHMVHIRDGRAFSSLDELAAHARKLMRSKSNPVHDNWMWEEMILEDSRARVPARDLKFYAFYGEVVIMRETARVDGDLKVAFWDAESIQKEMGHEQHFDFDRVGFTADEAKLVSDISLQIPHPYARIDMLKGEGELVVGEFTPRPGNFDEFNDDWDRILGEAWVRAESRLMGDLLRGKSFKPFLDATGLLE